MTHRAHVLDGFVRLLVVAGLLLSQAGIAYAGTAYAQTPTPTSSPSPEPTATPTAAPPSDATLTTTPEPTATPPATPDPSPSSGEAPSATLEASPSATPEASPTPTETAVSPTPTLPAEDVVTVTLDARGGVVTSRDGRVRLDVPPGVFNAPARVSIARLPVTPVGERDWLLARFDLRAIDAATDTELSMFEQPITLTVDLRGVANRTQTPRDTRLTILVADDEAGTSWSEAPGVSMPEYGLLVVPIRHFSQWAGGYMQQGWKLAYNAPAVSLFSGAATYNYPIEVPAGRNGFAAQINLSYNSRRVDALIEPDWNSQPPIGLGWSLDSLDVLREGVHRNGWGALEFPDKFTLLVNGTGYDLVPDVAGQSHGFYRAKDAPWLLARRINDCSDDGDCGNISGSRAPNASGEYWRVWLGDGTQARLGYTYNAEQTDLTHPGAYCPPPGYCGTRAVYRWRVDVMTDTLGNTMTFTYVEDESTANGLSIGLSRLSEIKYNNSTPPGAATPQYTTRIEFTHSTNPSGQDIDRIKVWNAGALAREYRLTLSDYGDYASADTCGQHVYMRELTAIQMFDASNNALPATTFNYTMLPHRNNGCAHYWYLSSVSNGYGGSTTFSYTSDGRQQGCWPQPTWINGNLTCDDSASIGLSYRVNQVLTYDGLNATPAKVDYAYGLKCYDQYDANTNGGTICPGTGYLESTGPLVGHQTVTETVYAYDNSMINRGVHTFDVSGSPGPFLGRELTAKTLDASGTLLQQTTNAYATLPFTGTTFAYLRQADHTTYAGGIAATRQVSYTYDAYGNLTRQYEMGDAARSGDERTLQYGFNPTNTVTTAALHTYWPRGNANASSTTPGFPASYAIDSIDATFWMSAVADWWGGPVTSIDVLLDAVHPVDFVKLYAYDWGFPTLLNVSYWNGSAWVDSVVDHSTPSPALNHSKIIYLSSRVNTDRIRITSTRMNSKPSGQDWESYFAMREVSVGATADLNFSGKKWIVNKPAWEKVCAGVVTGTCSEPAERRQTRYTYDGATSFSTPPSKGLLTGVATGLGSFGYVTTTTAYDAWGNPTVVTDTRGYTTTTTYESTYRLYPISVKNAKGHVTQYQYYGVNGVAASGYITGLLKAVIDPNSQTTTYTYDTFGRLWQVFRPGDGSDPSLQYGYWDNGAYVWVSPFLITVSQKPNSPIKQEQRHFYDGLGREIQTHTAVRATLSGYATAQDILVSQGYDARGNLAWQTVPYAVNAYVWNGLSPYTTANLSTAPRTAYQYDALGRTVRTTHPDGTTQSGGFSGWQATTADANEHYKLSESDAYGRLIRVDEMLGNLASQATATASSQYDGNYAPGKATDGNPFTEWATLGQTNGAWIQLTWGAAQTIRAVVLRDRSNSIDTISAGRLYFSDGTNIAVGRLPNEGGPMAATFPAKSVTWVKFVVESGGGYNVGLAEMAVIPERYSTTYAYDVLGNLTRVTDTLSTVTTMTYDPLGRKTAMTDPDMGAWSYAYDAAGNLTRQSDARGQRICFYYDPLNRLTGKHYRNDNTCPTSSPALTVTYTYDAGTNGKGRRTSMSDPSGSATWTYDTRGRLTTESRTLTGVSGAFNTAYGYDAMDRVITTTYPGGEVITQTYNAAAQLAQVRSATYGLNYASGMQYNALGQMTEMAYGNGELLRFGYRGVGGQWDSEPTAGLTSFGRLFRLRAQASAGVPLFDLRYGYDAVGNVTAIREAPRAASGWPTSGFTFQDPFDTKNTSNWTWSAQQTVPYNDGGNNVVKNAGTNANWNANFYRSAFSLTSGKGMQVRFKVDATNTVAVLAVEANDATYRRLGVVADSGKLYAQYNDGGGYRNPVDLLTNLQLNTWYVLRIVVDDSGRGFYVEAYQESTPSVRGSYTQWMPTGKSWRFHHWIWRGNAYLDDYREFSTSGLTWSPDERLTFAYDHLDRLTSAAPESGAQGYSQAFQYNAIGNLTSFAGTAYAYNDAAHKHAVTHLGGVQKYWYDANGSMTTRIEGGVTYQQAWDVENRLTSVTGNGTTTFTYDGDGARVKKVDAAGTTVYVGAMEVLINATQRITRTYYSAGAQLVAMRVMTSTGGNALYYLHSDHLGSTSLTTNSSGGEVARQKYYPYGQIRPGGTGSMPTDVGFTGQRLDATGLMFYRARYFSPVIGRFVSADTIVPETGNLQSLNRYSYVNNNPVKYTDPTGHWVCDEDTLDCSTRRWHRFGASANLTAGQMRAIYGIRLTADEGHPWTASDISNISEAVQQAAAALDFATWANGRPTNTNVARFFKSVLYSNLTFHRSAQISAGAASTDNGTITVYARNATTDWRLSPHNAVHELGHAISQSAGRQPYNDLNAAQITDNVGNVIAGGGGPGPYVRTDDGYATAGFLWQQHRQVMGDPEDPPTANEDFADMFLGWAYGNFANDLNGAGAARNTWMSANMPGWIALAVNGN